MSMQDYVELHLEKPVFSRGRIIRSLRLRAPTQAEIDEACAYSRDLGERGLFLVSLITGVPPKGLAKLSQNDEDRLGQQYDALTEGDEWPAV